MFHDCKYVGLGRCAWLCLMSCFGLPFCLLFHSSHSQGGSLTVCRGLKDSLPTKLPPTFPNLGCAPFFVERFLIQSPICMRPAHYLHFTNGHPRFRERKGLAQDHTASQRQGWDLNQGGELRRGENSRLLAGSLWILLPIFHQSLLWEGRKVWASLLSLPFLPPSAC